MRNQLFILSILLLLIGGFRGGVVSAETNATITVCNFGCFTSSWPVALASANNFDTISVESNLSAPFPASLTNKTLTILGNNHTISTNSTHILDLVDSTVTISNLEFFGGTSFTDGGAIQVRDESTLILDNVDFSSNRAPNGGAIYSDNSTVTISNSEFTSNNLYDEFDAINGREGGAIYSDNSSVTINNSQFVLNNARRGGAIYSTNGSLTVNNSEFRNNFTPRDDFSSDGGGAIFSLLSTLNVSNSEFSSNSAAERGGAIFHIGINSNANPTLILTANTFVANGASGGDGGGVWAGGGSIYIDSNLFEANWIENFSGYKGAGLRVGGEPSNNVIVVNNTIVDNISPSGEAGGIFLQGGGIRLENNTIVGNTAPVAANVGFDETSTPAVPFRVRNNIIAAPLGGGNNCSNIDLDVTYDNSTAVYPNLADDFSCDGFTLANVQPRLEALADNGGPTLTMAPAFNSPVLNWGNWLGTAASKDQRGVDRGASGVSDLGAYERVVENVCQEINQTIPGANSAGLTKVISVPSSLSGEILDVDVTLKLDTTFLGDIFASVTSPSNVPRTIIDRPDYPGNLTGCIAPGLNGVFDSDGSHPTLDDACSSTGAAMIGFFKPKSSLTSWNGTQADGNWTLNVTDATFGAPSMLNEWCVTVEYFPDSAIATPTAVNLNANQVQGFQLVPVAVYAALLLLITSAVYLQQRS